MHHHPRCRQARRELYDADEDSTCTCGEEYAIDADPNEPPEE